METTVVVTGVSTLYTTAGVTTQEATANTDLTAGARTTEVRSTTAADATGTTATIATAANAASTAETTWSASSTAGATTAQVSTAGATTAQVSTVGATTAQVLTVGSTTVGASSAGTPTAATSVAGESTIVASTAGDTATVDASAGTTTAAVSLAATTTIEASTAETTAADSSAGVTTVAGSSGETVSVSTAETTASGSTDAGVSAAGVTTTEATTSEAAMVKTTAIDSTAGTTDSAASTAGTTESAASTAGTTESAASTAGTTESAASTAGTTESAASTAGTTESAASVAGSTVSAASVAGTTVSAASTAGTTAVVISTAATNEDTTTSSASLAGTGATVATNTAVTTVTEATSNAMTTMEAAVTTAEDSTAGATTVASRTMQVTTTRARGTTTATKTTEALVDECVSGSHDCHENATCVDSDPGVGFSCECNSGYEGNGTHCQDVNECTSGVSGCSDICNNTVGSFVCDCPIFFKLDIANNKTCVAARSCDTSNPCSPSDVSTCAVTDSGYTCGCNSGYKLADGSETLCINVDECATGENNCDSTLGMCTDNRGGFSCSCKAGYTGAGTVGRCSDVNECTAGTAVCDTNADCVNTVGAYTCSCKTGYKSIATNGTGFPGECKEDRLMPFGQSEGHYELTGSPTSDATSSLIKVPNGLPLLGGQLCDTLYVLENGVIVATSLKETQDSVAKTIYRHPTTDEAAFGDPVCAVFAPFWADAVIGGDYPSKVWYYPYEMSSPNGSTVLGTLSESTRTWLGWSNFSATFALVVTYETMAIAGDTARDDMETNTFQAVVLTDDIHTVAITTYEDGGMQWDPQITDSNLVNGKWPAFVGIIVEHDNGSLIVVEDENSRKKTKMPNGKKDCSGPNVYCMDSRHHDSTNNTASIAFQADDNADNWVNPRKWCADWYNAEPNYSTFSSPVPCPLTNAHADLDTRFKAASDVSTGGRACYEQNDGSSFTDGGNSLCCYGSSAGAFIQNNKEQSGNVHRYARDSQNYQNHDVKPRQYCCQDTSSSYCSMYFEKRPMISTEGYEAPQRSAGAGDPHLTTLDGLSYSFNGYAEYLMATNTSDAPRIFQMQGRTKLADVEPGKQPLATVFSAIAVKQPTNNVQVYLDANGTSVDIYVDGAAYTHASIANGGNADFDDGRFQLVEGKSLS
ncbi:mucin-22-like [Branchiostoma lanceolatum]|uniref:mucin-22-like n=1 Tax=Branchiostoma lanceolatum TaxID=7740 RepID=UPI00345357C6